MKRICYDHAAEASVYRAENYLYFGL